MSQANIPKGCYCYDEDDICKYWSLVSEGIGYCALLDQSDEEIDHLLWDQVKLCDINKDEEGDR